MLGRTLMLSETSYTVVGVLPRGFWFPQAADAFVLLRPTGGPGDQGTNTEMIARLNPGVGLTQARAVMAWQKSLHWEYGCEKRARSRS